MDEFLGVLVLSVERIIFLSVWYFFFGVGGGGIFLKRLDALMWPVEGYIF